jgi:hypothetical protein
MISKERLLWDGRIQMLLGILCLLTWILDWEVGVWLTLSLLLLWQTGSALELYLDYKHRSRRHYLWWAPVSVGFTLWCWPAGLVIGLGGILTYAGHTLHDYRIVQRRPRSFWDL